MVHFYTNFRDYLIRNPFNDFATGEISSVVVHKTSDNGDGLISYASTSSDNDYLLFNSSSQGIYRGGSVNSGIAFNDNNFHIQLVTWRGSDGDVRLYKDGTSSYSGTLSSGTSIKDGGAFVIAQEQDAVGGGFSAGQSFSGDIAELIIYKTRLNTAQIKIVNSYLAAKYGLAIANDEYFYDATHGHEVAGIGKDDINNMHTAAQSAKIMKISNSSSFDNSDYLLFGHDNGDITTWTTTDAPTTSGTQRIAREWRLGETGNVGNVNITLDTTRLPARPATYDAYLLLVDADGTFSAGASIYPMSSIGGSLFMATNVDINNGSYVTFAVGQNITKQSGDFDSTTTWLIGIVPGSTQSATIVATHIVTLTDNQTIGALTIDNTGQLNLSSYILTVDQGTITNNGTFNHNTGTVKYAKNGNQDVAPINYYNLEINGSGIKILTGNTDVDGDLNINNASVTLDVDVTNNYSISTGGNWDNSGSFLQRNGTVTFDGDGNKTFTSGGTQTFYNLIINKGTGDITLNRSIRVEDTLTMTKGDIITGTWDITIENSGTISGGDTNSYIQVHSVGVVKKQYNSVPAPAITFPVGDDDEYSSFTFTLNNGTLSSANISLNLKDATHPNLPYPGSPHISRYWKLIPSGITGTINYDISYKYTDADVFGNESDIFPSKYSSGTWTYGGSSANTATNTLIWNGISSFSEITGSSESPLPIELISFDAKLKNDIVELTWTTASEINNDYFTVEKTRYGKTFEQVAIIKGAGTSNEVINYFAIDENPYQYISYYRLKQTDFDGKYKYSDLVSINNPHKYNYNNNGLIVYPNPSKSKNFYIKINEQVINEKILINIYDIFGKKCYSETIFFDKNNIIEIRPNKELHPGIYLISAYGKNYYSAARLIIE